MLYGSLALFVSILHNVFLLYYVETFVSVYKIDKLSFWVGEVGLFYIDLSISIVNYLLTEYETIYGFVLFMLLFLFP